MIDGVIKEAFLVPSGSGKVAMGKIHDDAKNRYPDGHSIRTSTIIKGPNVDGIIETRNSTYRLEMAA